MVTEEGRALLLDEAATTDVVAAVLGSDRARGIRLRVWRRAHDGKMVTTHVEEMRDSDAPAP